MSNLELRSEPEMQTNTTKTIMVIDDERIVGNLIKRIMEKSGYSAIVCSSSLEALLATERTTPELIISDFNLPSYSDGVDLCLRIRQSTNKNMPVIIISGQAENEIKARQKGFEFMCKPLSKNKLLLLVESCLNGSERMYYQRGRI
ncbi:MAG: response regulator [bacterium]